MARPCTMAEHEAKLCLRRCADPLTGLSGPAVRHDADTVHDTRVACRRTRVALAEFRRQFAPGPRRETRNSLREIRRHLGVLRELDVNLELLPDFADAGHAEAIAFARARLESDRMAARESLHHLDAELDAPRLLARIAELQGGYRGTTACHLKHAGRRLNKRHKRLLGQYKTWRTTRRDDDLHNLRVQFKKLRYTLEVYATLYGKSAKKLLRELETAQDTLGAWNDHRVLSAYLVRLNSHADNAVPHSLDALIADVDHRARQLIQEAERLTADFFDQNRRPVILKLFSDPARPCCDRKRVKKST